ALLQEVLDRPLDPGYASAAEERIRRGEPPSTGARTVLLSVSSLLIGFLLTIAVVELRAPDPEASAARAELAERIRDLGALRDEQAARFEVLRAGVGAREGTAVGESLEPLAEELGAAGRTAGSAAMVGPGLRVVLDEAPVSSGDPGEQAPQDSRVLARDLQVVVNGLWGHGA